jgi:hypothetical protein
MRRNGSLAPKADLAGATSSSRRSSQTSCVHEVRAAGLGRNFFQKKWRVSGVVSLAISGQHPSAQPTEAQIGGEADDTDHQDTGKDALGAEDVRPQHRCADPAVASPSWSPIQARGGSFSPNAASTVCLPRLSRSSGVRQATTVTLFGNAETRR